MSIFILSFDGKMIQQSTVSESHFTLGSKEKLDKENEAVFKISNIIYIVT